MRDFFIDNWAFLFLMSIVVTLFFINNSTVAYIGHGEMAHYPTVARNLLEGKGYTIDYRYHFYNLHNENITHPDDYWPIGNPTLIAFFFLIFGQSVFIAKLANVFLFIALCSVVYFVLKKEYSTSVGFFTVFFMATNTLLFTIATWPYADIGFLLFVNISLLFMYFFIKAQKIWYVCALAFFIALSIYFKQTGILLIPTFLLIIGYYFWKKIIHLRFAVTISILFCCLTLLFISPIFIREYINQGDVGFGLEVHSSMLKYQPWEEAYSLFESEEELPGMFPIQKYGLTLILKQDVKHIIYFFQSLFIHQPILGVIIFLALLQLFFLQEKDKTFIFPFMIFFALFFCFFILMWFFEERYFIPFFPIIYFLCALCIFQTIKPLFPKKTLWNLFLLSIAIMIIFPFVNNYYLSLKPNESYTALVESYQWMNENIPSDLVFMSRNPWELTYHTSLKSVSIPYASYEETMNLIEKYNITYIDITFTDEATKLSHQAHPELVIRPQFTELYLGHDTDDFELVYSNTLVYIFKKK